MAYEKDHKIGWAAVGLGKYSTGQILPNFAHCKHGRLAALVSGHPDKATQWASAYHIDSERIYDYDTFDQIALDKEVDAVYIATPVALHKEFVLRAAKAGKHVLCEKPLGVSSAECQEMIDACKAAGVQLMVAYRVHHQPHNMQARELVRQGKLGKLVAFSSEHGRPVKPEEEADAWRIKKDMAGGGSLMDIGIYAVNGACYLLDDVPLEVTASAYKDAADPRFAEVEDLIQFNLYFRSGLIASCLTSYSFKETKRYTLYGQEGTVELDPATDYKGNQLEYGTEEAASTPEIEEGNQFADMLDHLSQCILEGKPNATPGGMGLRDLRIIEAIYKAAETEERVRV